jgi:proliferating cell nuclear antigen
MKILLNDRKKKDIFVSLFQVLKNCSSVVSITLETECAHIQGMDKSKICLFDVSITKKWFAEYDIHEVTKICFDSNVFHSIISTKGDGQDLVITLDNSNSDTLHINFVSQEAKKGEYKKSFKMPLVEYDYEEMHIPNVEYDAEFSLSAKQISEMFSQLSNFGNDIIINCSEEDISLSTNGVSGEMTVDIPIDDISSYSIVEGEKIILTYSLAYINKMCITNKLSTDVDFYLSNDMPMKIRYDLGDDSSIMFFIAPKMND